MADERDERLGKIIADFLQAAERGETVDGEALVAAHPELADDLRSFFANHERMRKVHVAEIDPTFVPTAPPRPHDLTDPAAIDRTIAVTTGTPSATATGDHVRYFGDYELLEEIARGGMGVVYKARQVNLKRVVALKMILAGQLAGETEVKRFRAEAEAAAKLDHPNIVPIFEVGEHNGRHYFSMGFVNGRSLADRIAAGPLPPDDAASLVKTLAEAIQYAHGKGVIHRDLKPANVLLEEKEEAGSTKDETPAPPRTKRDASFVPRITDFGLAKKIDDNSGLTAAGQILGTPAYMPPEQAAGKLDEVTETADVYSLGAILYCLLVGRPPFQAANVIETIQQVLADEPARPRQLNPAVPLDLETICLKCLEKERSKRYASAQALADELGRFGRGEPILARPVGRFEHTWRWCRRNPVHAALWAMCLLLLLVLGIGGPILAVQQREVARNEGRLRKQTADALQDAQTERDEAERQRTIANQEKQVAQQQREQTAAALQEAQKERDEAQRQRTIADQERQLAQRRLAEGQLVLGRSALQNNRTAEALNWFLHAYLNAPAGDPMQIGARNIIGAYFDEVPQTLVHPATVHQAAVSPDRKTLWAAYLASRSQLWDLTTDKPIGEPLGHSGDVVSGSFSPDGTSLLTGDWNGANVWDSSTGKPRYPPIAHANREDTMIAPEFSPDGLTIATRDTLESVRLWDAKTGKPRCPSLPHNGEVWRIRFSPDSKLLAAQAGDEVRVWDSLTGEVVGEPWLEISDFALHPGGQSMAVCRKDGKVALRVVRDGSTLVELEHDQPISRVQFDAAGKNLLGYFFSHQASPSQTAVVWRSATGDDRSKLVLREGQGLWTAALSPNGEFVALVEAGRLRVVQTRDGRSLWSRSPSATTTLGSAGSFEAIEFSSDSRSLLARGKSVAHVFRTASEFLIARDENLRCSLFSPDGKRVVFGSDFGRAHLRSLETVAAQPVTTLTSSKGGLGIQHAMYTSDGRTVVTAGRGQQVQFWDAATWQLQGEPIRCDGPIGYMALSPDDKKIALMFSLPKPPAAPLFAPTPGRYELWDVATRKRIGEPIDFPNGVSRVVFDLAGKTIAIDTAFYDLATQQLKQVEPDPDGQMAVVKLLHWKGSFNRKIWDEAANAPIRIQLPAKDLVYRTLTRQGRLLGQNKKGEVRLWDAATGEALGPLFPIDGTADFYSDSGRYIVGGRQEAVQIWDTYTGKRCGQQLPDSRMYMAAAFNPTESLLATTKDFQTRLWDCATGQMLGPVMQNRTTGQDDLDFSPDGRFLLCTAGQVQVYPVPQPAIDDRQRLRLQVEVRTGLRVDENGTIQRLNHKQWLDRKAKWDELADAVQRLDRCHNFSAAAPLPLSFGPRVRRRGCGE